MKRFSGLFLVSLLSGATTLGAYKLFFENDGFFSDNTKSIVTTAPVNYTKTWDWEPKQLILQLPLTMRYIL